MTACDRSFQDHDRVKEGQQIAGSATQQQGILQESRCWEMKVDLKKQLHFPEEVARTTLRPDIIIWSRSPKKVILVELTVPWEERIEEAYETKKATVQARMASGRYRTCWLRRHWSEDDTGMCRVPGCRKIKSDC